MASPPQQVSRTTSTAVSEKIALLIAFVTLFALVGSGIFGFFATLAFLGIGASIWLFFFPYCLAGCVYNWPLFIFPLVAILSTLWADYPALALRGGIQIMLSTAILVGILYILPFKSMVYGASIALILALFLNIFSDSTVEIYFTGETVRVGYFGSKNNLSSVTSFATLVGITCLILPGASLLQRGVGLVCALFAGITVVHSKSLGTSFALLACIGIVCLMYWYSKQRFDTALKILINLVLIVTLLIVIAVIWSVFNYELYQEIMYGLGKDPTLTGRTRIWEVGFDSIRSNPFLGVGWNSYWTEENRGALEIWALAKREIGVPFGFHNLYIQNYVELGILGFLGVVVVFGGIFKKMYVLVLRPMRLSHVFALSLFFFIFMKSFLESAGFGQFSLAHFQLCLAWMLLRETTYSDIRQRISVVL